MTDPAPSAKGLPRWPYALGGGLVVVVVLCAGLGLYLSILFPSCDDIRITNKTAAEITDVRLIDGHDVEVARFPRIAAGASATAPDMGTGRFSVAYSDARGRWIGDGAVWFDDDDIRTDQPVPIVIADGRAGGVGVKSVR